MVKEKGEKAVLKLDPNSKFLSVSLILNSYFNFQSKLQNLKTIKEIKLQDVIDDSESPEFTGKVITALACDPNIMKYNSKVVIAAEYAQCHNIKDIDNRTIPSHRQINSAMKLILPKQLHFVTKVVPDFVKLPQFCFDLMGSKF